VVRVPPEVVFGILIVSSTSVGLIILNVIFWDDRFAIAVGLSPFRTSRKWACSGDSGCGVVMDVSTTIFPFDILAFFASNVSIRKRTSFFTLIGVIGADAAVAGTADMIGIGVPGTGALLVAKVGCSNDGSIAAAPPFIG
jgi:hypothetical protein